MKQIDDVRRGWTSASNAAADSLCPGRHLAQKTMGSDVLEESTEDSSFGDQVHAAMADGAEPADKKVLYIVERMREIDADLLLAFFGEEAGQVRALRERRLWTKFSHKGWALEHSGQVDVAYIHKGRALIVEYKALAGDLDTSPTNLQLRDQAVLVRGNVLIPEIGTAVNQPMVEGLPKIATYTKETLDRSEMEMQQRIVRSNTPGQERVAGDVQCKFCTARFKCPEYGKWTAALTPRHTIGDLPVESWTPDMMVRFLEHRTTADKWLKECYAYIKQQVKEHPDLLLGWKLVDGNHRTTITDMPGLWKRLNDSGLSDDELIAACKINLEHLETLVRVTTKAKGKALKAEVKKILDGVSIVKQDQPSLERSEE